MAFGEVFDTREFDRNIKRYTRAQRDAVKAAMGENRDDLERRAKNMAPKDEGNLEGSIAGNPTVTERRDEYTAEVHAGVSGLSARSNAWKYALKVHETMWPAIPVGGPQVQPGPITQSKGDEAGPAGGKYLTRPLLYKMKDYTENIARHVRGVK